MADRELTCGNCPHLRVGAMNWLFCQKIDAAIPHNYDGEEYILWRIPITCPRPDTEVSKSEMQAPKKYWVKKQKVDIKPFEEN